MESGERKKLLLVEDETVLRRLIAEFLQGEGFEVMEAADGSQGAETFARCQPFDLVLLDLNLPFLSGVDVCRRIKAIRPRQPVLICSAAILDWHVLALQDMQVDQYLTKPYHPLELLDRIGRELSRSSPPTADVPDRCTGDAGGPGATPIGVRPVSSPVQAAPRAIR